MHAVRFAAIAMALALGVAASAGPPGSTPRDTAATATPLDSLSDRGEVAGAPVGPPVPWPPTPLPELPDRDPARAAVERAWQLPGQPLADRVARTRRAGLALGMRDLEPAARAALMDPTLGDPLTRAEHAVALAPGLPAAHAALAQARLHAGDLRGGVKAFAAGLRAIPDHLEASAWTRAVAGDIGVALALAWAGIVLLLGALGSVPALVHALGATRVKLPGPAALVTVAIPVLALSLLAGPAGAVLGLGALAVASGSWVKRLGICVVSASALLALHVGTVRAAEGRLLLAADPVATAVHRVESGLATPSELGLVRRAASSDWDAARAAAIAAKRAGDARAAAAYFARVIEARPDAEAHNNAANVAFGLHDLPGAIHHYQQATRLAPSAVAYFNLSQAYGRTVRLDDQDRALAQAQRLDLRTVEQLASLATGKQPFVADITFPVDAVLERARATGAAVRLAAAKRHRVASGWLAESLGLASILTAAVLGAGLLLGLALERAAGPRDFYADLARTLRGGVGDSAQRVAQLTRLRARRARTERLLTLIALIVPGAAGFRFGRPLAALAASFACAGVVALWAARESAPADPFALGVLPGQLLDLFLAACALGYVASTALAFALRTEE